MSTIHDCLAAFSGAAMMKRPDAVAKGARAIDDYLMAARPDPRSQLAALHKLYAAYLRLGPAGGAALAIKTDIELRIVDLSVMPPEMIGVPERVHAPHGRRHRL